MGNKINPHGLRVGVIKDWDAKWYADKNEYSKLLNEDREIRSHVKEKMFEAGVSKVVIERAANRLKLDVHTARPGMVIGRGGSEVEALRNEAKANVKGMLAIFSYGFDVAENNFKEANIQLNTLSNYQTLIQEAFKNNHIFEKEINLLNKWRENPSEWNTNKE